MISLDEPIEAWHPSPGQHVRVLPAECPCFEIYPDSPRPGEEGMVWAYPLLNPLHPGHTCAVRMPNSRIWLFATGELELIEL